MKLSIQNLGRIDAAEFDLRPLSVFVGKNNTNKSWAAYAAYTAMGLFSFERHRHNYTLAVEGRDEQEQLDALLAEVDLDADAQSLQVRSSDARTSGRDVGSVDGDKLGWFLRAGSLVDSRTLVKVEVPKESGDALFSDLQLQIHRAGDRYRIQAKFRGERGAANSVFNVPRDGVHRVLTSQFDLLVSVDYWRIVPFPVERTVLFGLSGSADRTELYAGTQGVVREFDDWTTIARALPDLDDRTLRDAAATAMGGSVEVTEDHNVEFHTQGVRVDIAGAASMIRSMGPLQLYLARLARPGDVLVIDEPEMNAHPEAQLAIIELFATMVNAGYRILFTTHSPYMLEHLDTLMEGSRLDAEGQRHASNDFTLRTPEIFLDPEKVAVYEFCESEDLETVVVRDVLNREEAHIDTHTFGRVTSKVGDLMNVVLDHEE